MLLQSLSVPLHRVIKESELLVGVILWNEIHVKGESGTSVFLVSEVVQIWILLSAVAKVHINV